MVRFLLFTRFSNLFFTWFPFMSCWPSKSGIKMYLNFRNRSNSNSPNNQVKELISMRILTRWNLILKNLHCFKADQAAMAAFFSACFLFLAGSPVNVISANSTVPVKTGKWPRPDLNVVYWGNGAPTLCAISCKRFLYTPVSS